MFLMLNVKQLSWLKKHCSETKQN